MILPDLAWVAIVLAHSFWFSSLLYVTTIPHFVPTGTVGVPLEMGTNGVPLEMVAFIWSYCRSTTIVVMSGVVLQKVDMIFSTCHRV